MHSVLVVLAYLSMLFAPCAVAQWGDVLMIQWTFRLAPSRRRVSDPMLVALRRERRFAAARALAEIAPLADAAFVTPTPSRLFPQIAIAKREPAFATAASLNAASAAYARQTAFEQGTALVAARLAQLAEAYRLVNQPQWIENADAPAASSPKRPVVRAHIADPSLLEDATSFATPTACDLERLYGEPAAMDSERDTVPLAHPHLVPRPLAPDRHSTDIAA